MATSNRICVHPERDLTEVDSPDALNPPSCGACECPIAGDTYHCGACDSDLHPFCRSCPPQLSCPLHPHPLTLLTDALPFRRCDVCDEDIKGVSYTCSHCGFDLHPQCSRLPLRVPCIVPTPGDRHLLHLQVGPDVQTGANCDVCGDRCGMWAYRCGVCTDVSIHYWCLSMRVVADSPETEPVEYQSRGLFRRRRNNNNNNGNYNNNNNNNNNYINGGRPNGRMGRFMGRMVGSVAVGFISDMFGNMMDDGDFTG